MKEEAGIEERLTLKFMIRMFMTGMALGLVSSIGYACYLKSCGGWEKSTSLFHTIVLFFGLSFTVPAFTVSLRLMYRSLVLGLRALKNQEDLTGKVEEAQHRFVRLADRTEAMLDEFQERIDDGVLDDLAELVRPKGATLPSRTAALEGLTLGKDARGGNGNEKGDAL